MYKIIDENRQTDTIRFVYALQAEYSNQVDLFEYLLDERRIDETQGGSRYLCSVDGIDPAKVANLNPIDLIAECIENLPHELHNHRKTADKLKTKVVQYIFNYTCSNMSYHTINSHNHLWAFHVELNSTDRLRQRIAAYINKTIMKNQGSSAVMDEMISLVVRMVITGIFVGNKSNSNFYEDENDGTTKRNSYMAVWNKLVDQIVSSWGRKDITDILNKSVASRTLGSSTLTGLDIITETLQEKDVVVEDTSTFSNIFPAIANLVSSIFKKSFQGREIKGSVVYDIVTYEQQLVFAQSMSRLNNLIKSSSVPIVFNTNPYDVLHEWQRVDATRAKIRYYSEVHSNMFTQMEETNLSELYNVFKNIVRTTPEGNGSYKSDIVTYNKTLQALNAVKSLKRMCQVKGINFMAFPGRIFTDTNNILRFFKIEDVIRFYDYIEGLGTFDRTKDVVIPWMSSNDYISMILLESVDKVHLDTPLSSIYEYDSDEDSNGLPEQFELITRYETADLTNAINLDYLYSSGAELNENGYYYSKFGLLYYPMYNAASITLADLIRDIYFRDCGEPQRDDNNLYIEEPLGEIHRIVRGYEGGSYGFIIDETECVYQTDFVYSLTPLLNKLGIKTNLDLARFRDMQDKIASRMTSILSELNRCISSGDIEDINMFSIVELLNTNRMFIDLFTGDKNLYRKQDRLRLNLNYYHAGDPDVSWVNKYFNIIAGNYHNMLVNLLNPIIEYTDDNYQPDQNFNKFVNSKKVRKYLTDLQSKAKTANVNANGMYSVSESHGFYIHHITGAPLSVIRNNTLYYAHKSGYSVGMCNGKLSHLEGV